MGSKFGSHVTTGDRSGYGDVAPHCRIVTSKLADAGLEINPDTFFIYRPGGDVGIYTYNGVTDENIMPGFNTLSVSDMEGQAEFWWPKILTAVEAEESRLGITVDAIQPINEAEGDDPVVIEKLIAYETRIMELANEAGRKIAFGSYAPNSPHIDLWKQYCVPFLASGWQLGHLYNRHVYLDFDPLEDNATRVFDEIRYLEQQGIEIGPIALTEWGFLRFPGVDEFMDSVAEWDLLLADYPEIGGFCAFTYGDWNSYAAQIAPASGDMSAYLQSDPFVKWEPFSDPPTQQDWKAANILLSDGRTLEDAVLSLESRVAALESSTVPEPTPEPLPLPDGHNYPLGVDLSKYQYQNTNWVALKEAGVSFAFIRLGSAYTLKDANFDWNWQNAGLNNILRGAYWYLYPDDVMAISSQIDHVLSKVPASAELPLVVDVEQSGLTSTMVQQFVEEFAQKSGYSPTIYTGAWYWVPNLGSAQTWASAYDLWVANYTLGTGNIPDDAFVPRLPDVWSTWKFWQWTSSGGELVGQSFVPLDLNYFNGSPEQLLKYSQQFIESKQPPPIVEKVNVLDFIRGIHKTQFDLDYGTGTQTTQVWHLDANNWLYIKGDGQYERLGVRNFNGVPYIWRFEDTSESNDRWYAHFKDSSLNEIGAPWCPVEMEVDKEYTTDKFVQHFLKSNCSPQNGGSATDTIKLISKPYTRTYQKYNKAESVITLEWVQGGEQYDFAGGNIGFRDATRDFQFMGWLEGRTDKDYIKPGCFDVGW